MGKLTDVEFSLAALHTAQLNTVIPLPYEQRRRSLEYLLAHPHIGGMTSAELLAQLRVSDAYAYVRSHYELSYATLRPFLERSDLSFDDTRMLLEDNPRLPVQRQAAREAVSGDALTFLSRYTHLDILANVAANPATPTKVLSHVLDDLDACLRRHPTRLGLHCHLYFTLQLAPLSVHRAIAQRTADTHPVLLGAAVRPDLPSEELVHLLSQLKHTPTPTVAAANITEKKDEAKWLNVWIQLWERAGATTSADALLLVGEYASHHDELWTLLLKRQPILRPYRKELRDGSLRASQALLLQLFNIVADPILTALGELGPAGWLVLESTWDSYTGDLMSLIDVACTVVGSPVRPSGC